MKRFFAVLLIVSLLVVSTGCDKFFKDPTQSSGDTQQAPETTQSTAQSVTTPQQLPMIAVAMPIVTQTQSADDGAEIFRHSYQNMNLTVTDPEVAEKIIVDFLNRIDMQSAISSVHASAKQAYSQNSAAFVPYWTQIIYEPVRIDNSLLSLSGRYTQYSGGAHPMHTYQSATYDLVTGNTLTLADVLAENVNTDTICQLVLKALAQQKEKLYMGYETTVSELFSKSLADIDSWCLTDYGLCFAFSPYEIGPYSSDIISAQIPYNELDSVLKDAYFPAERDIATGTVHPDIFDEKTLNRFSQFAEILLSNEGEKIVLHTEGAVYDIRLETGSWSADGKTFTPAHTVFAAYTLTPGDAIMVQSSFKTDLPELQLTYKTGEKSVTQFLNAKNGLVTGN